jgi:hypothetical protein
MNFTIFSVTYVHLKDNMKKEVSVPSAIVFVGPSECSFVHTHDPPLAPLFVYPSAPTYGHTSSKETDASPVPQTLRRPPILPSTSPEEEEQPPAIALSQDSSSSPSLSPLCCTHVTRARSMRKATPRQSTGLGQGHGRHRVTGDADAAGAPVAAHATSDVAHPVH